MDNNISFKSKINFVPLKKFNEECKNGLNINYYGMAVSKNFRTQAIRTCTAGGIIEPKKGAIGFHFYDRSFEPEILESYVNRGLKKSKLQPNRGLIIGGKDLYKSPKSMPQFQFIKKLFKQKVDNLSIFGEQKHKLQESNIHYSTSTDTWSIASRYIEYDSNRNQKIVQVEDINSLKNSFKHISIADGDQLFINGKEISAKDNPEFFHKKPLLKRIKKIFGIN